MKASASITITSYTDGLTTFYQYAKNTSNTSPPTTGWSATMPPSEPNKFIWRREATALSLNDVTAWVNTMCLTGSTGAKGDPGAAGAVGQGVESIIEEYYLSTSKTEQTGGSWVPDPPTWSTGKYMWTRSKITYKNPTDTEYTTPVCDSSWEAVNLTEDELKKYIQSRGENLVTNGSGLLGSNYNFSAFTYDGSEAYYSNGSFRYYGEGEKFTDEFMPVNPELAYKLSMFAKTANGAGRYYAMVVCFDVDNQVIMAPNHMYRANTLTTLSQELKNGDTVVHLTDASNWYNEGTAGVSTHLRSIILWNYKNSYGYLYPPQTYSRNWIRNAWNPGAINFENNTITLISPWAGGTVEAGTPLSNGSDGSTYKYCAMSNTIIPTTWTEYAGVISGIDLSGSNVSDKFPPGTAKVKIGWLLNYQGSGETIWIANLAFNIHLATQSELDSTKLIVNSSVKSTDVEYYLSTSSTSLSGGSWQTTAPAWVDGKFMWSRTRVELNNGTVRYTPSESGTCIAGATGPQGPMGNPGQLGLYADGETLYLKGFADDGTLTAENGNIYGDGQRLVVPAYSQELTADGQGYVIFDGSTVQFAKLIADGTSKRWIPYNGGDSIGEGFWVIGSFTKDGSSIYNLQMVFPERSQQFERSHFMDILASGDMGNITKWAEANGVGQVFEKIAAFEIFTNALSANKGFITSLFSEDIELGGQIRANYTPNGDVINPEDAGFWLSAKSGILKAQFAELIGTVRTGRNAPTDARVAIQDESGITSGPTFTGSGLNDLTITKAGYVAGNFRVKISGINNATNSGEKGYWATPVSVGTRNWYGIAVNSAGRFVAVGVVNISYSNDGITWATPASAGDVAWYGIAVNSAGKFVAVGGPSGSGYVSYSNDGITWVTPFQVGVHGWIGVAVNSAGKFVAVGRSGYVSYSNDGITWATPFQVGTANWGAIAVNSSGRFVAVGVVNISYSNDGITWATPASVGNVGWYGIAVNSAGRFVAVGSSGYVSYSNDGITWVTPFQVGVHTWTGVAVNSAGKFVAVGADGYVSYSNDGITWVTPFRVGNYRWEAIAVNSAGRFVAVGDIGYITMSLLQDTIQISSNGGTTWGSDIPIPLNGSIPITGFGIDISFGHAEGHTVGDYWSFEQGAMRGLAITDSAGNEYFSASNGEVHATTVNSAGTTNKVWGAVAN